MSRYVPKHARKRRGPSRAAVLLALVGVAALAAIAVGVTLSLPGSRAGEADASGAVAGITTPRAGVAPATAPSSTSTVTTIPASTTTTVPPSTSPTAVSFTTTTIYTHPIPEPVRVVIPAIGVDAKLIAVGLLDNGDMEVPPFGLAGWYEPGPIPGSHGPAVIVAHVDTKKGPDVFYRLRDLQPGDEILVRGEDGDVATFVVDSKEQQLKTELPVERIWNDTWEPVIRLITCAGEFDRGTGHYLSNIIVYGHLVR